MNVTKAVITAAGRGQRTLPLQTLIDSDGTEKSVLSILIEEVLRAGIEEICLVVRPGDEARLCREVGRPRRTAALCAPERNRWATATPSTAPTTSSAAIPSCTSSATTSTSAATQQSCAQQLVQVASSEACAVSAVQATRESLLPYYGTVGGQRVRERADLYRIETVIEKPTPTEAEQQLIVPACAPATTSVSSACTSSPR